MPRRTTRMRLLNTTILNPTTSTPKRVSMGAIALPTLNLPTFKAEPGKDYVAYGDDNLYGEYLDYLYMSSSMHQAIVKGCADLIYGLGLDADNKDEHVDQWLRLVQLFDNGKTLKRAAFDLKLYGQCYLNPIWSVDRTQISVVHHLPAAHIRVGKVNDNDEIETFYHSTEWDKEGVKRQAIPAFNSHNREAASTVIMIKLYNPLSIYYGLPDYVGSTNYIHLDKSISEFHLNNIENGLFPSMMVSFNNGIPTDEEQQEIERNLYAKFGGATGAKLLISFNDSHDNAPKVEQIRIEDQHKMYEYLSKEVAQKILSGHRVTSPLLFGIRDTGGGFGSNADEMREAFELFQTTVIQPIQEELLAGIRPILSCNAITLDLKFGQFVPAPFLTSPTEEKKNNFRVSSRTTSPMTLAKLG